MIYADHTQPCESFTQEKKWLWPADSRILDAGHMCLPFLSLTSMHHQIPECMTIYREESHTPYQESLETPDLLPCGHLSRYLDSQGERDQYFIGAVGAQQFTGGWC